MIGRQKSIVKYDFYGAMRAENESQSLVRSMGSFHRLGKLLEIRYQDGQIADEDSFRSTETLEEKGLPRCSHLKEKQAPGSRGTMYDSQRCHRITGGF